MKTILLVLGLSLGAMVLLILVAYLIGVFLPADHVAEGDRIVGANIEAVAARIRDLQNQPEWRPGVKSIELLAPIAEVITYREVGSNGPMSFRFREVEPGRRFESVIADDTLAFGGRWTISVDPADAGTRVKIREEGTVRPPIFRTLSRFVFGHQGTLKQYLNDLAASFPGTGEAKVK